MHKQTNELTKAQQQATQYRARIQQCTQSTNNTHQTHAQREHTKQRLYETEAKLHLLEIKIAELQILHNNQAQAAQNFETEYLSRNNNQDGIGTNYALQEAQYLKKLAILEIEHQRTISNAIHFREFAEKAQAHTPERVKRTELAEYWEKRADNIERHINKHLLTAPEPPGDEKQQEGGVPPSPQEKTPPGAYKRPGNHIHGPRPKQKPDGEALRTSQDTKKAPQGPNNRP